MRLAAIREGDIIQVAGGYALVTARRRGRGRVVEISWLGSATYQRSSRRWVGAREIEAHWRRATQRVRTTSDA